MERGLLWLPLLIGFGVLVGLGWWNYRKVETYRDWAQQFDRSKYDPDAVLGWKGDRLSWGKPTRRGPTAIQSIDLDQVEEIQLQVDGQRFDRALSPPPPERGKRISLVLQPQEIEIPFAELPMALAWWRRLMQAVDPPDQDS